MKSLKLLFFVAGALVFTVACKDTSSTDQARQVPATTTTPVNTQTPSATPTETVPVGTLTTISYPVTEHDFGEIMEGEKIVHEFSFKNSGSEPLVISKAQGSCGCTVPDWPREPIPVGGEGVIKVQYD